MKAYRRLSVLALASLLLWPLVAQAQETPKSAVEAAKPPKVDAAVKVVVKSVSGEAEFLLPETEDPKVLEVGLSLPLKTQIFTGDETIVRLDLGQNVVVTIDALSEFTLDQFAIDRSLAQPNVTTRMRLKTGKVDVDIAKGEFTSDMKIATPNATASVTGSGCTLSFSRGHGTGMQNRYGTMSMGNQPVGPGQRSTVEKAGEQATRPIDNKKVDGKAEVAPTGTTKEEKKASETRSETSATLASDATRKEGNPLFAKQQFANAKSAFTKTGGVISRDVTPP